MALASASHQLGLFEYKVIAFRNSFWQLCPHMILRKVHSTDEYNAFFAQYAQRINGQIPSYFPKVGVVSPCTMSLCSQDATTGLWQAWPVWQSTHQQDTVRIPHAGAPLSPKLVFRLARAEYCGSYMASA